MLLQNMANNRRKLTSTEYGVTNSVAAELVVSKYCHIVSRAHDNIQLIPIPY
ncbi:MAG: hypothetical protein AB8H12_08220 [Lewinella sp.]